MNVSLVAAQSYLPSNKVSNEFFLCQGAESDHPMFKGTRFRHHVSKNETAVDMIEKASSRLIEQLNLDVKKDIDIILTNVTCLEIPFTGCGADVAYVLGANPQWIIDHHNGGCVSFLYMVDVARALMSSGGAKTALICNVQNSAGRIFSHLDNRHLPQSAVPGDGCGVGYMVANESSPIITVVKKTYGEYAGDMTVASKDGRQWWEPGEHQFNIEFSEKKISRVISRGNKIVPQILYQALDNAGIKVGDIDKLITNQPNLFFLRNWRESVMLSEEQHIHTFAEHGNLFGAALPIAINHGVETNKLNSGDTLLMGGFSHAGDYTAAAIIQWQKNIQYPNFA